MEKKLNENISSIPCNEQTLVEYLRKVADAHGVEFIDDMADEYQVLLKSESVPVLSDVKSVIEAFCYGINRGCVECDWGYITVYMYELRELYRDEVDMNALEKALPRGTVEINETKTNKNMKKKVVKLNETTLRKIVAESVKKVLKEDYNKDSAMWERAKQVLDLRVMFDAIEHYLDKDGLIDEYAYRLKEDFDL